MCQSGSMPPRHPLARRALDACFLSLSLALRFCSPDRHPRGRACPPATKGVYRAPFATITISFARIFRVDSESGIESSQKCQKRLFKNNNPKKKCRETAKTWTIRDDNRRGRRRKNRATRFQARELPESHREAPKSRSKSQFVFCYSLLPQRTPTGPP